jgi:hypothetical protein
LTEEQRAQSEELLASYPDRQCLFVSAVSGEGLEELKELMVEKTKWIS